MSSTKIGDEFLCIPKLDATGTSWVIYKDRFTWSIDAQVLLHHLDGSEEEPDNPISNRDITTAFTPAEVALDGAYKKDLKTWRQGEAVVQCFLIFYHHHPTVGICPSCTMSSLYYLTPHP
jgi:hypothetical protein